MKKPEPKLLAFQAKDHFQISPNSKYSQEAEGAIDVFAVDWFPNFEDIVGKFVKLSLQRIL